MIVSCQWDKTFRERKYLKGKSIQDSPFLKLKHLVEADTDFENTREK